MKSLLVIATIGSLAVAIYSFTRGDLLNVAVGVLFSGLFLTVLLTQNGAGAHRTRPKVIALIVAATAAIALMIGIVVRNARAGAL